MRRTWLAASLPLLLIACDDEPVTPPTPSTDLHDPLSMPEEPTLEPSNFRSAEFCADCHPNHYAQWKTSSHAYAMQDPVYRALVQIRQTDFGGKHDQFCTQCHSAIGTRGGECDKGFTFSELSSVVLEGVTCEACHKVKALERQHNSGHVLDELGPLRATIEDPIENGAHESEYSALHGTAEFCSGCHDVIEYNGINLERPYAEFAESPAHEEGRPCQTCHMPSYTGPAAKDGPDRVVHDHRFVGVGVPLRDDFLTPEELADRKQRVADLLASAATLSLDAEPVSPGARVDLHVTVGNEVDGHNLPTGSTFNRQTWLTVTARDANGALLYETGTLDANGDVRGHFSELDPYGDPDLITFDSGFVDDRGSPTIFSWRASEHVSTTIPPLYRRTRTLFVPTSSTTPGPIQVEATLHFRTYRPHVLRALGLDDLVERVEIHELARATLQVDLR